MTGFVTEFFRFLIVCYPKNFASKMVLRCSQSLLTRFHGNTNKLRKKKMTTKTGSKEIKQLSRMDWLAASVIFILPLVGTALHGVAIGSPGWAVNTVLFFFLGSMGFAFLLAVIRGLPRWSFSYLGFALTIFVFYGLLWGLWGLLFYQPWMLILGPMDSWSLPIRILYQGVMTAFMWFLVLLTAIIMINLLKHWSHIHALWQHIREDWTHLSFLVYGGLIFYIGLIFDEYQHDDPWKFAAFTGLAIGAWVYLLAKEHNKRFLALVCGATAAMWIVAIGKWIIIPMQNWQVNLESERLFEPLWAISSWFVTIAALAAPALLNLLPFNPDSSGQEEITPA